MENYHASGMCMYEIIVKGNARNQNPNARKIMRRNVFETQHVYMEVGDPG